MLLVLFNFFCPFCIPFFLGTWCIHKTHFPWLFGDIIQHFFFSKEPDLIEKFLWAAAVLVHMLLFTVCGVEARVQRHVCLFRNHGETFPISVAAAETAEHERLSSTAANAGADWRHAALRCADWWRLREVTAGVFDGWWHIEEAAAVDQDSQPPTLLMTRWVMIQEQTVALSLLEVSIRLVWPINQHR